MATFSVTDTVRRTQATGNGSLTTFSFSFQVNATSDLKVYVGTTLKSESTHYAIQDGSSNAGLSATGTGVVVFTSDNIPANNAVVTIVSDVPLARTSVYTAGGSITAAALESDFDTITMALADREERDSRTLRVGPTEPLSINMELPSATTRANHTLAFDTNGSVTVGDPVTITGFTFNNGQITPSATNDPLELFGNGTGGVIVSPHLTVDTLKLDGNTFSSTDTNGDINIFPNGSGTVNMNADLMVYGNDVNSTAAYVQISASATGGDDIRLQGSNPVIGSYDTSNVSAQTPSMLGALQLYGKDTSNNYIAYVTLRGYAEDPFAGTNGKEGSLRIQINDDSSIREHKFTATGLDVYNNITLSGTVDGRDLSVDGAKLDGIEANATADQTNTEIRTAVEAANDSNVFTDADHSKLNAIEASADVTDTANVVAALSAGTGVGISNAGEISVTAVALTTVQTANSQSAHLALTTQEGDVVVRSDENKSYMHNGGTAGSMSDFTLLATPTDAVLSVNGNTGAISAAQIATAVEAASNSNTFTDTDHSKLNGIEAGADVNIGQYFMISANSQGVANGEIITTHPNASGVTSEVIDFTGGGATTVARSGNNLTFTSANTTYSFADSNGTVTITPSSGSAATLVIGTAAGSGGLAMRGNAGGADSVALGTSSNAIGANAISIGKSATTSTGSNSPNNGIAIGEQAHSYGSGTTALGRQASAIGDNSIALGSYASVPTNYYNSVALGTSATVTAANQIMLGTSNKTVKIPGVLEVTGTVTANAGVVVDEMTLDGDTLTATDTFTIDAVGDITLDADGSQIYLKDNGTLFGEFSYSDTANTAWDFLDIKAWGNSSGNTDWAAVRLFSGDNEAARFTSNGTTSQGQMTLNYPFSTSSGSGTYDLTIGSANKSIIFLRSGVSGSDADGTQYGEFSASSSSTELTAWNGAALNLKVGTETAMNAVANGAVTFYYDNDQSFKTKSAGIDIGDGQAGGVSEILFSDNATGRAKIKYNHGSDPEVLTLETAGSVAMTINNAQNTTFAGAVTINNDLVVDTGTNAKLTINDNISEVGSGNLAFQTTNSAGSALKPMGFRAEDIRFATGSAERLRITNTGYISMAGASDVRLTLGSQGTEGNNDANWVRGNGTSLSYNSASANHIWEIGGAEKMRMDSAGTLFLGTTTPTLHSSMTGIVFDNGSLLNDASRGASKSLTLAQNLAIDSGNTWAYLSTDEGSYYQQFNGNHYFGTAPSGSAGADATVTSKLTILNGGNVGIGVTPSYVLDVSGDKDDWISRIYNTGSDANAYGLLVRSDATAAHDAIALGVYADGGYKMVVRSTGNVAIGTTSANAVLTTDPESGNFSSTYNNYDGVGLFIRGNGTSGNGNYGPALVFGSCDSDTVNQDHKHSAISVVQTDTDPNQTGLAFWTHPSATSTDALVEAMRIDASGNVGIGATSVDELLHLEKSSGTTIVKTEVASNSTIGFEIKKTNATTSNWRIVDGQTVNGKLEIYDVTNSRNIMTFDQSGNVGIGTSSPSAKLHINGVDDAGATDLLRLTYDNSPADTGMTFTDLNQTVKARLDMDASNTNDFELSVGADLRIYTGVTAASSANERLTILTGGNVGIGDSSPARALSTKSSTAATIASFESTSSVAGLVSFSDSNTTNDVTVRVGAVADNLVFQAGGSEQARIASAGEIQIGGTTNAGFVDFDGTSLQLNTQRNPNTGSFVNTGKAHAGIALVGGDADSHIKFYTKDSNNAVGAERVRIDKAGRATFTGNISGHLTKFENQQSSNPSVLWLNTSAASPDDNSSYFMYCSDSTTLRCAIYSDGDIDNHDNSYSGTSDQKLKQQITNASSQWDDIKAMQVRKYKMNEDVETHGDGNQHWRLGVIAQELEASGMSGLVNDRVDKDADGNALETTTKSVKYSILYMKAVKALQEAMTRIETLEAKVTALEE